MSMSSMRIDSTCRPQACVSFSTCDPMAASICSRSDSSSSRLIWPTTSRSDVRAYCATAKRKSWTRTMASAASATRKNRTPSMVTGTLSRVITCWRVISSACTRVSTRLTQSTRGITKYKPGPFTAQLPQAEHDGPLPLGGQPDGGRRQQVRGHPDRQRSRDASR